MQGLLGRCYSLVKTAMFQFVLVKLIGYCPNCIGWKQAVVLHASCQSHIAYLNIAEVCHSSNSVTLPSWGCADHPEDPKIHWDGTNCVLTRMNTSIYSTEWNQAKMTKLKELDRRHIFLFNQCSYKIWLSITNPYKLWRQASLQCFDWRSLSKLPVAGQAQKDSERRTFSKPEVWSNGKKRIWTKAWK